MTCVPAWASSQSDQRLHCLPEESLYKVHNEDWLIHVQSFLTHTNNAPVTCKPNPFRDTAGLKYRILTSASSLQCLVTAWLLIPGFNTMENFYIYLPGFEQGFQMDFTHKNGSAVQGICWGFASRKVKCPPLFPSLVGAMVTNDWCIMLKEIIIRPAWLK